MKIKVPNKLAFRLRAYFTDHLPRLRGVSAHTVHSYRDSLLLLLRFLASRRHCHVADLDLEDIEPEQVLAFLLHLEEDRKNGVPTRNVRLAAIHAFFRYIGACHPEHLDQVQRVVGIPFKRARQRVIEYLEGSEIEVILSRINRANRDGRRDYTLLATMFNTGARVQEIVDLRITEPTATPPDSPISRFCCGWISGTSENRYGHGLRHRVIRSFRRSMNREYKSWRERAVECSKFILHTSCPFRPSNVVKVALSLDDFQGAKS